MYDALAAGLAETKFSRPEMNKFLIHRQSLHLRLNEALFCKYTMVTAPAGYGKTSAVLDWLEASGQKAAWLSLDLRDNDPVVFWRYVCYALDEISSISKETDYILSSFDLLQANIQINIMIDCLSAVPADFFLVLDDLHLITEPSILKGLSCLIEYMPPQMHLILISRTEPDLDLAKDKIKWQIQQIDEKDLRFHRDEISMFYLVRGFSLNEEDVKAIEDYSEGWVAALVAIAMSMQGESGSRNSFKALSYADHDILQYLRNEVVNTWSGEKRIFAEKTCILDTLGESLCDAVTEDGNGRRMISELSRGNGFLNVLDRQKQEYRYHHLFRSFLLTLLTERAPQEIAGLHKRAAVWLKEHGLIKDAIDQYIQGGLYHDALELFEYHVDDFISRNEFGTLLSWITSMPEALTHQSFKVAFIYCMYYAETGRYELARSWMGRVKELLVKYQPSSNSELNRYRQIISTLAEAYLAAKEGNADCLSIVISAGEINEDNQYIMHDFYDYNPSDIYFYRCPVCLLTRVCAANPDLYGKMVVHYRKMLTKNPGYKQLIPGEYFYETNRLDKSLPCLLEAVEEAQTAGCPGALVPAMVNIARINKAGGDMQSAMAIAGECERMLQRMGKPHWLYLIQAFRCRLDIDVRHLERIRQWAQGSKLNVFTDVNRVREYELIVYARVLMLEGCLKDAEMLLLRLLTFTRESARNHSQVEVLNLLASLAFEKKAFSSAFEYLECSLELGMQEGYIRSFLDEGVAMARMLKYYHTRKRKPVDQKAGALTTYAKILLKQMHTSVPDAPVESYKAALWVQDLTEQEKKVLALLMNANTNKEISDKLGIGLRTVKTYTGNIYLKLGVKNRAQCAKLVGESGWPGLTP